MSQRHELAIRGLQERVASLETRLAALEEGATRRPRAETVRHGPYKPKHKHLGSWIIEDAEGNVCEEFGTMTKADARRIAGELNGPQH